MQTLLHSDTLECEKREMVTEELERKWEKEDTIKAMCQVLIAQEKYFVSCESLLILTGLQYDFHITLLPYIQHRSSIAFLLHMSPGQECT